MPNINVQLKNAGGDILYPQTDWNLVQNKPSSSLWFTNSFKEVWGYNGTKEEKRYICTINQSTDSTDGAVNLYGYLGDFANPVVFNIFILPRTNFRVWGWKIQNSVAQTYDLYIYKLTNGRYGVQTKGQGWGMCDFKIIFTGSQVYTNDESEAVFTDELQWQLGTDNSLLNLNPLNNNRITTDLFN